MAYGLCVYSIIRRSSKSPASWRIYDCVLLSVHTKYLKVFRCILPHYLIFYFYSQMVVKACSVSPRLPRRWALDEWRGQGLRAQTCRSSFYPRGACVCGVRRERTDRGAVERCEFLFEKGGVAVVPTSGKEKAEGEWYHGCDGVALRSTCSK